MMDAAEKTLTRIMNNLDNAAPDAVTLSFMRPKIQCFEMGGVLRKYLEHQATTANTRDLCLEISMLIAGLESIEASNTLENTEKSREIITAILTEFPPPPNFLSTDHCVPGTRARCQDALMVLIRENNQQLSLLNTINHDVSTMCQKHIEHFIQTQKILPSVYEGSHIHLPALFAYLLGTPREIIEAKDIFYRTPLEQVSAAEAMALIESFPPPASAFAAEPAEKPARLEPPPEHAGVSSNGNDNTDTQTATHANTGIQPLSSNILHVHDLAVSFIKTVQAQNAQAAYDAYGLSDEGIQTLKAHPLMPVLAEIAPEFSRNFFDFIAIDEDTGATRWQLDSLIKLIDTQLFDHLFEEADTQREACEQMTLSTKAGTHNIVSALEGDDDRLRAHAIAHVYVQAEEFYQASPASVLYLTKLLGEKRLTAKDATRYLCEGLLFWRNLSDNIQNSIDSKSEDTAKNRVALYRVTRIIDRLEHFGANIVEPSIFYQSRHLQKTTYAKFEALRHYLLDDTVTTLLQARTSDYTLGTLAHLMKNLVTDLIDTTAPAHLWEPLKIPAKLLSESLPYQDRSWLLNHPQLADILPSIQSIFKPENTRALSFHRDIVEKAVLTKNDALIKALGELKALWRPGFEKPNHYRETTLLHAAADIGNTCFIQTLNSSSSGFACHHHITRQAFKKLNEPNLWGNRPSDIAARKGHADFLNALGRSRFAHTIQWNQEMMASLAAKNNHSNVINILFPKAELAPKEFSMLNSCFGPTTSALAPTKRSPFQFNKAAKWAALRSAAHYGHLDIVRTLRHNCLTEKELLPKNNNEYVTIVKVAITNRQLGFLYALEENPDVVSQETLDALYQHIPAKGMDKDVTTAEAALGTQNYVPYLRLVAKHAPSVFTHKNVIGETFMHQAFKCYQLDAIKIALDTKLPLKSLFGSTAAMRSPVLLAAEERYEPLFRLLIEARGIENTRAFFYQELSSHGLLRKKGHKKFFEDIIKASVERQR